MQCKKQSLSKREFIDKLSKARSTHLPVVRMQRAGTVFYPMRLIEYLFSIYPVAFAAFSVDPIDMAVALSTSITNSGPLIQNMNIRLLTHWIQSCEI